MYKPIEMGEGGRTIKPDMEAKSVAKINRAMKKLEWGLNKSCGKEKRRRNCQP